MTKDDAVLSDCGTYRYSLTRHVGYGDFVYAFFGINPSTADAMTDDQTVRKLRGYCQRNAVDHFIIGNVFSYRATDVKELARTKQELKGPEHWRAIGDIINRADALVPCWGSQDKIPSRLRSHVDDLFGHLCDVSYRTGKPLLCFGKTKDGDPLHPLTLGYDRNPLRPYSQDTPNSQWLVAQERVAELGAALEPVMHWYQSDEEHPRPLADIVRDVVADLQDDRKDALLLNKIVVACRRLTGGQAHEILPAIWPMICEAEKKLSDKNEADG